ncbi:DUF7622 domain-containing protein [Caenorhabditis elegans]|uniref:DUF7622 domain-containing protein n=1 Tax=Caenorhabditis elegans TaxID=6239 RepID=Q6BES5_CAEEL|nr:UPAR/Ly6 domain-containing protein [Caenorhabditis elegans]CAH04726.3 UPAR/Ly6 domain-containing protein [Caenorhabditis elegans]|eukprot:NP_001023697.3 Uncharacterized protein CELE_C34B4.4 [Caenorhabditis elegans]
MRHNIIFILCFSNLINLSYSVKCYRDNRLVHNQTCEGDFCVARRSGAYVSLEIDRLCITGPKMPKYPCTLLWDDELTCYCNTDYCNSNKLFYSNYTVLPVIECKQVHNRNYKLVTCNKCLRIISYTKNRIGPGREDHEEKIQCSILGESADFVIDTNSFRDEMIARNFYTEACYNVSMHQEHFYVFCRCSQTNCNSPESPIPYPLSPPTVSCFTSGFEAYVFPTKYSTPNTWHVDNYKKIMSNESYVDENSTCHGDMCFIAKVAADAGEYDFDVYYKGCISTNEHGNNSIQLGYMYLNEIAYHICNTNFCNFNISTAQREARNGTLRISRSIDRNSYFSHSPFFAFSIFVVTIIQIFI